MDSILVKKLNMARALAIPMTTIVVAVVIAIGCLQASSKSFCDTTLAAGAVVLTGKGVVARKFKLCS
jgi:hypothetical protein